VTRRYVLLPMTRHRDPLIRAATAIASLIIASCSEQAAGPSVQPGLRIVGGAGVADTIQAVLASPLIVEVRDEQARAQPGVAIEFRVRETSEGAAGTGVRISETSAFTSSATAITDANGLARAFVRLGFVPGAVEVDVVASATSLSGSASYTVLPGNPARLIVAPRDTALLVGGSFALRVQVTDRLGHKRNTDVTFGVDYGSGTVTPSGVVTGTALGRVRIGIATAALRDSALVSVVPTATFAAFFDPIQPGDEGGIVIFRSDGAQMRVLSRERFPSIAPSPMGSWPSWSPAGDRLAYVANSKLFTIDTAGTVAELVAKVPGTAGAGYPYVGVDRGYAPQYSADGVAVYFTAFTGGGQRSVWRAGSDGSGPVQVSQALDWGIEAMPSPQPRGNLIAYQTNRVTNDPIRFTIRLVSLSDGTIRQLDVPGSSPRWSPVGDRIAYLDREGQLRTMRPDGSDDRLIGRNTAQPGFSWSPDGKWLLIVGRAGVTIVDATTGDALPLALRGPNGTPLYQPAWRP
jgi:hypothetical protein